MPTELKSGAHLERRDGKAITLVHGDCSFGRSTKNSIILESPTVSRRHAIINVQDVGEFWLIDLGSDNGTFVNKRRIHQPIRLRNGDEIVIADHGFVFRLPEELMHQYESTRAQQTVQNIAKLQCWLLVADIQDFTPLSRRLDGQKLARLIGGWISSCKEIVEEYSGMIDKYLGDGFLAYWRHDDEAAAQVAKSVACLREVQERNDPTFRIALHYGSVAVGGVPSMGEESLMGKEVNFVFRMEKLAGSLRVPRLTSSVAKRHLGDVTAQGVGDHALKGFPGTYEFYAL